MAKIQNLFNDILNDTLFEDNSKNSVAVTEYPLLVLSACNYRLKQEDPEFNSNSLLGNIIINHVTDIDIEFANKIGDYYSKKLMLLKLKGKELTKFRKELVTFLHDNFNHQDGGYHTPEKFAGMAYKLPYFYTYDTRLDMLFDFKSIPYKPFKGVKQLKFVTKLFISRKHWGNIIEYWFVDSDNAKYKLDFNKENMLCSLLEKVIEKNQITVSGVFGVSRQDYEYFVPSKYILDIANSET